MSIEAIIFYILALDSISANIASWFCKREYRKIFGKIAKKVPANRVWSSVYLLLVIWIGTLLFRMGKLPF